MHIKCSFAHVCVCGLYKIIHRFTNLTAFGALICLSTPFLSLSASFAMGLDDTQGGAGGEEDSKTLHWQLVVRDDFAWRRIIVWDGETINGIGGGIVGSRYRGVPRTIISVFSLDQDLRWLYVAGTGRWMGLTRSWDTRG